jgi:hypothetical protein
MRVPLLLLLLLTGCAGLSDSEQADPGGMPDDAVVSTPIDQTPQPGPTYQEVEPRDGLVDVVPHIWDRVEPVDQRTLRVEFYGGVEECEGLDRVEVEETEDDVTITLHTGRVREAEVCIEIAVLKSTEVGLGAPLGDREIVDGAA